MHTTEFRIFFSTSSLPQVQRLHITLTQYDSSAYGTTKQVVNHPLQCHAQHTILHLPSFSFPLLPLSEKETIINSLRFPANKIPSSFSLHQISSHIRLHLRINHIC